MVHIVEKEREREKRSVFVRAFEREKKFTAHNAIHFEHSKPLECDHKSSAFVQPQQQQQTSIQRHRIRHNKESDGQWPINWSEKLFNYENDIHAHRFIAESAQEKWMPLEMNASEREKLY